MTLQGYIVGTKGNTGRGIASIVENADYTITINLTDGTSFTTAPIAGFTAVDFDENYDLVVTKTDGTTETVETDIEAFRTVLAGYKSDAETAETNASGYATAASGSASTATSQATLAKSYAKGGTSSRTGEDTDNADYYRGLAAASATAAGTSESNAGTQALKSEGYAVGKQNGTDVSSGSDYYHNNAKYYSDMAHIDATDASDSQSSASGSASTASAQALKSEGYAVGKQNGTDVTSGSDYYQNNSKYYKEQAATSASSASTNALKAEGFAVGEQNGTAVSSGSPYYENNAEYYAGEAADSATAAAASAASLTVDSALSGSSTNPVQNKVIKGELDNKANIDGYYESLGSGTADQLSSNIFEEDSEPYNFRTSGGSIDIGDRETDMIVGGTVGWNQLLPTISTDGWEGERQSSLSISGTTIDVTCSSGDINVYNPAVRPKNLISFVTGHKYLCSLKFKSTKAGYPYYRNSAFGSSFPLGTALTEANTWKTYEAVANATSTVDWRGYFGQGNATSAGLTYDDVISFKDIVLIDLTAMFGSTIADYIYSLEQATAGAGVAWFRKLFPKPYYAYNAGELMSVQASSHDMVGFNQLDSSSITWTLGIRNDDGEIISGSSHFTNEIRVLPNTTYCISGTLVTTGSFRLYYLTESKEWIARTGTLTNAPLTFTTPSNCGYIQIQVVLGITNLDDVCINLSWDGERDGEYEEYVKHSYPLDSSLTLRGIPKLDASNNLYYDGDTYESDGTVTRKYGIVDLGSLNWKIVSGTAGGSTTGEFGYFESLAQITNVKAPSLNNQKYSDGVCSNFLTGVTATSIFFGTDGGGHIAVAADNKLRVSRTDDTKDASQFKTAMNGVYLVYELATPTTETADPYTNPQIVNDFGTEEYVDYAVSQGTRDVAIPVGHETQYMANLKAKLEMSPNSPEGAGDYIVRQTNGENEYVTLASNATIQDIIARLEALEGGE